jgi:hypothetical protein
MDKAVKAITVRFTEENYESVKKYAEEHKESISDAVNRVVKKFFSESPEPLELKPEPAPSPPPSPRPSPIPVPEAPEIPEEILGLPERLKGLEAKEDETRQGVEWLASQVEDIQEKVNELLRILKPTLPVPPPPPIPWPPSPPWGFTRARRKNRKGRDKKVADDL